MASLPDHYPRLSRAFLRIGLGNFPTPVEPALELGRHLDIGRLFIKRDDVSGTPYGGNKVRKLQYILGQARKRGVDSVLTFGYAGSNHAAATSVYADMLQMRSDLLLVHQPNARYVRTNLLVCLSSGARLVPCRSEFHAAGKAALTVATARVTRKSPPLVVPPGGSGVHGTLGFVDAALELAAQVDCGDLPMPDVIYVPLGSMGTTAGLLVGLKLAGLKTIVRAVRVVDSGLVGRRLALQLAHHVNRRLSRLDPGVPRLTFHGRELEVSDAFLGPGYAVFTPEGRRAGDLARDLAGLCLDGTYTAKAFAALIHDAKRGLLSGKTVVFWHTCNSRDLEARISGFCPDDLPQPFRRYFREPVQDP